MMIAKMVILILKCKEYKTLYIVCYESIEILCNFKGFKLFLGGENEQ